jgi:hypothetical protein
LKRIVDHKKDSGSAKTVVKNLLLFMRLVGTMPVEKGRISRGTTCAIKTPNAAMGKTHPHRFFGSYR